MPCKASVNVSPSPSGDGHTFRITLYSALSILEILLYSLLSHVEWLFSIAVFFNLGAGIPIVVGSLTGTYRNEKC